MLRSFLLPRLRRHDCRSIAQLGRRGACWTKSLSEEDHATTEDADQPSSRRRHLYLVLDDWKKGFSIHKLDLDDGSDGGDLTLRAPVHRQATECGGHWNFASVGSKIVATGRIKSEDDNYATLMYDTKTAGLSIVPPHPAALRGDGHCWHLAAADGERLYTLEANWKVKGAIYRLEDMPAPEGKAFWWGTRDHWSWSSIPIPPPFHAHDLESSAVHPQGGGRTLFVSIGECDRISNIQDYCGYTQTWATVTFSYDTVTNEWRRHGEWDLPFCGQACYDGELEAWLPTTIPRQMATSACATSRLLTGETSSRTAHSTPRGCSILAQ
jgi:hypothetical protein